MTHLFAHSENSVNENFRYPRRDAFAASEHNRGMKANFFLKQWRNHRRMTLQKLADASGWSVGYLNEIENGRNNKQFTQELLEDMADALDTTPAALISIDPSKSRAAFEVPLTGYVAANGEQHYTSDYEPGQGDGYIPTLIDDAEMAVTVRGQSMMPRYREGDTLLLGAQSHDPMPFLHRDVVARIAGSDRDDHKVLKTLKMGRDGFWTLKSINPLFDDITDVALDWVRPVLWVKV
jgi:transcriptional regulator with XRE-family HTH domain